MTPFQKYDLQCVALGTPNATRTRSVREVNVKKCTNNFLTAGKQIFSARLGSQVMTVLPDEAQIATLKLHTGKEQDLIQQTN